MKKISILLFMSFVINSIVAQNIYFTFVDGTNQQFALANVQNITFSGNNMNLNMKNGTTESWSVFDIDNYNYKAFTNTNVGIEEQNSFSDFKLYPNPAKEKFIISFNNEKDENIVVELLDIDGKSILSIAHKNKIGENTIDLSNLFKDLANGIYFCKISSNTASLTETIIKN